MDNKILFRYIVIYIIFLYLLICYFFIDVNELLDNILLNNNCICIITRKPKKILLDFLKSIVHYDIYMVVDDNNEDYKDIFKYMYPNINFIQIDKNLCKDAGYMNVTLTIGRKDPSGWEKALYYFSRMNKRYNNVWFIEDDVYFYDENTLLNIDQAYPNSDLLSNKFEENKDGKLDDWHWDKIMSNIKFDPPYYKTMVCAVRMSNKLLECISNYAKQHNTLFFLEVMYVTLAIKNNLIYSTTPELHSIHWRKD